MTPATAVDGLVDGLVGATWALRRGRGAATVEVRSSLPRAARDRDEVEGEAPALLAFPAAGNRYTAVVPDRPPAPGPGAV